MTADSDGSRLGRETQEHGTKIVNLLAKACGIALQGVQNGGGGI